MTKYKVRAQVIGYCYLEVEANSIEEANEIAEEADGGDFTPEEGEGEFSIMPEFTMELEKETAEAHLFGFDEEQKKNVLAILEKVKEQVTDNYASFDTGGNFKHFFVQKKTGEWLGFHKNTGDITLSKVMEEKELEEDFLSEEGIKSCEEQIKQNHELDNFSDPQIPNNIIYNVLD